ncbi:MAG TPA: hypothetical protein VFK69_05015 [Candidatus Eisenbacteria bacterium]|nr:hypothetical protein [Candidatus Eisenbacteria bacterium]
MRFAIRIGSLAIVLLALGLAGCRNSAVPIRTLLDDPSHWDGRTVRVAGTVTRGAGLLGYGAYTVDDGTGQLNVVSQSGGAPREGASVGVEGTFRAVFTLGTTSGAVLIESRRTTR